MFVENAVVQLTDAAILHIKKIASQTNNLGVRLSIKKTGCSGFAYITDMVNQGQDADVCYDFQGLAVFVDAKSINLITGTVVDFIDKGFGQTKLVFENPNATSLCGCGESFTVDNDE